MMHDQLLAYINTIVNLRIEEQEAIVQSYQINHLQRGESLYPYGKQCRHIYFINTGLIRHFHYNEKGEEITCDFSFENQFLTDYKSFTQQQASTYVFQAMEKTSYCAITQEDLDRLYALHPRLAIIGQREAEKVALRVTAIAQDLLTYKAEARYLKLQTERPEWIARIPQRYLATYLGIKPESLSRIRKNVHR